MAEFEKLITKNRIFSEFLEIRKSELPVGMTFVESAQIGAEYQIFLREVIKLLYRFERYCGLRT